MRKMENLAGHLPTGPFGFQTNDPPAREERADDRPMRCAKSFCLK